MQRCFIRAKSTRSWIRERKSDNFVTQRASQRLNSRSAFKLIQLQEKFKFIKPESVVVDLGAAPGGWSQVCTRYVRHGTGRVLGVDLLPINVDGVESLVMDMSDEQSWRNFVAYAWPNSVSTCDRADVVVSDMSPSFSGNMFVDSFKVNKLAALARTFSLEYLLKPKGVLVVKCFAGDSFAELESLFRRDFLVYTFKPAASRSTSPEKYLVAYRS